MHMNDKTTNKRGEVSTSMSGRPRPGKHSPIPSRRDWAVTGLMTLVALCLGVSAPALADPKPKIKFDMLRSTAAINGGANCAPDATGRVKITSLGPVEEMDVDVSGLPPNTEFDFFVIQLPNAPFGLAWYQGDIETDDEGEGHQTFRGRFNIETFIVAQPPGGQPAPVVHDQPPFPDASTNPATEPVHTFHTSGCGLARHRPPRRRGALTRPRASMANTTPVFRCSAPATSRTLRGHCDS